MPNYYFMSIYNHHKRILRKPIIYLLNIVSYEKNRCALVQVKKKYKFNH